MFFYLLGYYASTYMTLSRRVLCCGLICLVVCLIGTSLSITCLGHYGDAWNDPASPFYAIYSLMLFLLFRRFLTADIKECRFADLVSRYSFGIYLVHPIFLNGIYKVLHWIPGISLPNGVFECTAFAISFLGSLALTALIKKLPVFKSVV